MACSELIGIHVPTILYLDSDYLFTSLSKQRISIDYSIRGNVACIKYEIKAGILNKLIWIPEKLYPADVLTGIDSLLSFSWQFILFTGRLAINFELFARSKASSENFVSTK